MPRHAGPVLALSVGLCLAARAAAQAPLFRPAPGSPIPVGASPSRVILADLDGDGDPDLVTLHSQARRITIWLGDGSGGFAPAPGSPVVREYAPGDIAVGDADGDRLLDLAMTRSDRDVVDILRGDGRGGFHPEPVSVVVSGSTYPFTRFLHLVDLNEDDRLDLVTATDGRDDGAAPTVMLGDGRGGFSAGPALALDPGGGSYSFAFGDVDGDRHLDLVLASRAPDASQADGRVVIRRGDGRGGFLPASRAPLPVPSGPRLGALADVNGDGRPDLVLAHGGLSLLSVLLNNGGGFAPAPGSPYEAAPQAFGIAVADVNRDARADILAATVQNQAPPYESGLRILLGNGDRFVAAPGSPVPTGPGSYRLTVADVNGDGTLDVLAPSGAGDGVVILLGRPEAP